MRDDLEMVLMRYVERINAGEAIDPAELTDRIDPTEANDSIEKAEAADRIDRVDRSITHALRRRVR